MPLQPNDDTFYIKQGNNVPVLEAQLTDENDQPLNLEFADDVLFRMIEPRSGDAIFQRRAIVENVKRGVVQYAWVDGDTDLPGRYRAEFIVIYPGGREETFPNFGYRDVMIWGTEKSPPVGADALEGYPAGEGDN